MVNIEFVNCNFLITPTGTTAPAVFVNCVFRNTVGRPAIVVQSGAFLSVKACIFYNNTNSPTTVTTAVNVTTNGTARMVNVTQQVVQYGGNGSAIYVQPRGSIQEISDTAFKQNGWG
mgnify:CR=1 FL=1